MEDIKYLIEEAKKGIITVSDFYKDEIFNYFLAKNIIELLFGILFISPTILIPKLMRQEWFKDELGLDVGGFLYIIISTLSLMFGLATVYNSLSGLILLYFAPKIYITKEIVSIFSK